MQQVSCVSVVRFKGFRLVSLVSQQEDKGRVANTKDKGLDDLSLGAKTRCHGQVEILRQGARQPDTHLTVGSKFANDG